MTRQPVHTVLFDLDGTLTDTAILTKRALVRMSPVYGLDVPTEKMMKEAMGYATIEYVDRLYPDAPDAVRDEIISLIDQWELDELENKKDILFDGCLELLERLQELGIRMCLVSTGTHIHVHRFISETGIAGYFDVIVCDCEDKTDAVREMIRGSDKRGIVFVGDMLKDYDAARRNGILSVGACYGYCDRGTMEFDLFIDHPMELLDMIQLNTKDLKRR